MAMPWMKMSLSFRMDPKIESLSDAQHRVWYKIMVFAAEQRTRGLIRFDSAEILAVEVSRGDVDLLNETVSRLVNLGLVTLLKSADEGPESCVTGALHGALHGGSILVKNYEIESVTRNASVTRDRVRKFRESKKLRKAENGNVTPLKRDVTHVTDVTHRELDEEKTTTPRSPSFVKGVVVDDDEKISAPKNGTANGHAHAMALGSSRMPAIGLSGSSTVDSSSPVRNGHHGPHRASKGMPTPDTISAAASGSSDGLDAWARSYFGDRYDLECIGQHIDSWRKTYQTSWIKWALQIGDNGCKHSGLAAYVTKILIRWDGQGGPDHEAINKARAKQNERYDRPEDPDLREYTRATPEEIEAAKHPKILNIDYRKGIRGAI